MCKYYREHDERDRRLDEMGPAEDREWKVRFVDETCPEEFEEWRKERVAEEVREDRIDSEEAA